MQLIKMCLSRVYLSLMVGCWLAISGCNFNPVVETYGKGINKGLKAIDKARELQNQVDTGKTQLEEQVQQQEGQTQDLVP